tara:strand:+ start:16 stop:630 length:615 start_codon:yes stop_codon:yes gene_type:complete
MKLKNVDSSLEKIDNVLLKSLCFLDNHNVYISLVFILFLYNTCIFKNINHYVSDLYDHTIIRVLVLLLIIYTARKSCLISILLGISFVVSLNFKTIMENFVIDPLPNSNDDNLAPVSDIDNSINNNDSMNNTINDTNVNNEETLESFQSENTNFLNKKNCDENYPLKNESVGNDCSPVSTFSNELNAQGLNSIIGYDKQVGYQL